MPKTNYDTIIDRLKERIGYIQSYEQRTSVYIEGIIVGLSQAISIVKQIKEENEA